MNKNAVKKLLRQEIKKVKTQKAWAKANGVSRSFVCEVLLGRKGFSETMLDALGLEVDYKFKD